LRDLSEDAMNLRVAGCSIEIIGTAECNAGAKAWTYAAVPDHAAPDSVASELRQFAKLIQIDVSGASRGL
jgi:hypothetical protein